MKMKKKFDLKEQGEMFRQFCIGYLIGVAIVSIIFVIVVICQTASAHDEDGGWFCTSQASSIVNGVYTICGVAESYDEAYARSQSLTNAYAEFKALHPVNGNYQFKPGRMDCTKGKDGQYKCLRLIKLKWQSEATTPQNI